MPDCIQKLRPHPTDKSLYMLSINNVLIKIICLTIFEHIKLELTFCCQKKRDGSICNLLKIY